MTPEEYPHKMKPFKHQSDHFSNHYSDEFWGLLWEQGTAKTKPIIDTASLLYLNNEIDGVLIVAPPGVERNWKTDEFPKHLPESVVKKCVIEVFLTAKKNTKNHKRTMDSLISHTGLSVMLISYNAFMTKEGKDTVWKFLSRRRVLYVLDEAHMIKTPSAKRTKSIIASGKYAKFRRILTGTPSSTGPFDFYSQIKFLNEDFWKNKGIGGAVQFRQYFGEWFTAQECKRQMGYDPGYDKLIRYKNIDILEKWLTEISDRHLKTDVLDLPPKLYSKRYFDMTPTQKAIYTELEQEFMYEFENGSIVDGELPIVRLLRLQQILCNYVPTGDEGKIVQLDDKNPRLKVMEDLKSSLHQPTIVWARFVQDIDQIMHLLGDEAVRYDGSVDDDQAERNKAAFQAGDVKWFVGTAQKGGPGLTLHQAKNVVYYSNSFRLIDRLQSEDRAHRAGMDNNPVNYIDIICSGTIDEKIVTNLREKRDIVSSILGDKKEDWL